MDEIITLSLLKECESAIITKINVCGSMRRRLQDLGLICGTRINCVLKKSNGKIAAYRIRGALIALRKSDTDLIEIEYIKDGVG